MEEAFDEAGEDGGDHAEGEHVERDGEEDEGGGGSAALGWVRCEGGGDELGLGEEGIGVLDIERRRVWGGVGHKMAGGGG